MLVDEEPPTGARDDSSINSAFKAEFLIKDVTGFSHDV